MVFTLFPSAPGQNFDRADLKTILDAFQHEVPVKKLLMISQMALQGLLASNRIGKTRLCFLNHS
jgi:hypothetical protein